MFDFSHELSPVFEVSEFNELIRNHLGLLGDVEVVGEISQIKIQNQLVFITIKDKLTSLDVFGISYQIPQVYSLEKGMNVQVSGTASLFQKSSRFHLRAKSITPVGIGSLERSYQLLKERLTLEGLFDEARKRPLPSYPQSILLLTAAGSQAYLDFVKVSKSRFKGVKISHLPIQVQGTGAVKSIINAINYANYLVKAKPNRFDALVLTRGGGSLEDLAAFNDETVVRAVFGSTLPTVCAIGHEGDISLAELASDQRASTPTDAAVVLVPEIFQLHKKIVEEIAFIKKSIQTSLDADFYQLSRYIRKIDAGIKIKTNQMNSIVNRLESFTLQYKQFIKNQKSKLALDLQTINSNISVKKLEFSKSVDNLDSLLDSLDPKRVLKRGYSITKNQRGQIISTLSQIKPQDHIITQVYDGKIFSKITLKEPDEKEE